MKIRVGQSTEIIYQDKTGKITQRKIEIIGIRTDRIRANCLTTGAPRAFFSIWDIILATSTRETYA